MRQKLEAEKFSSKLIIVVSDFWCDLDCLLSFSPIQYKMSFPYLDSHIVLFDSGAIIIIAHHLVIVVFNFPYTS